MLFADDKSNQNDQHGQALNMNRRDFLKIVSAGAAAGIAGVGLPMDALARVNKPTSTPLDKIPDMSIDTYLEKMNQFNQNHEGDVYLDPSKLPLLDASLTRFKRLQRTVGFGNFYLLDFDEALKIAKQQTAVGAFPPEELGFVEMIFYGQASEYGFFGEKPFKNLTDRIPRREVVKVPFTGNYLYRGKPLETYERIRKVVGDDVILTSGVRSVIKQFLLFLDKTYQSNGNMSRASRSLAPPGYSFHGVCDFDVGQVGYGSYNFTERFVTTRVFRRLREMGYLPLRYPKGNKLGVRFEPWHVMVNDVGGV